MVMKKYRIFILLFLSALSLVFCASAASAEDNISEFNNFNPNYIISDFEILHYNSMSLADIQSFLENKGSFLATYSCPNAYGTTKKASEIIYEASMENYDCDGITLSENATEEERRVKCKKITTVSPKFLLVLLQKEQSLTEDPTPKQSQLDWAMGYGCPDGDACNTRWKGFGKQVNSAALQFLDYLQNPQFYTYKSGNTYTFTNPYSTTDEKTTLVTPMNSATAGLYNYTPHVYNGNYNFYKIWQRYFSRFYPDGSLLQAGGEPGVWLIQNGQKRPFLSKGALTSRFDQNKIIVVNKADLDVYPKGSPIKFPQYSLVKSPTGIIYLLVDDKKRGFVSNEAFKNIGFNPDEVVSADWGDLDMYIEGEPILASSTYLTGALLQDKTTGGVFWVFEGKKAPIWDKIFLKTKFKNKKIIPVKPEELNQYTTVNPVLFDNGELLKSSASSTVYLIAGNKKRPVYSAKAFEGLGYKWNNIITVSPKILYLYEDGEPINESINL